jgi:hypothetical protein
MILSLVVAVAVVACQPAPIPPFQTLPAGEERASMPQETIPAGARADFPNTDFSQRSISLSEVLSGGVPKDGIPAIDNPVYVPLSEAESWLADHEPVISVVVADKARAYPIQILIWHEIVNDVLNDKPLAVTFCPLCNTAIVFERKIDGVVYDFGTTGRLRFSNLIMYDRQTESWWQQAGVEAIVGELTGTKLPLFPAQIISWEAFKNQYPNGDVLSKETGFNRPYGNNPYTGYDDINQSPFLYDSPVTPDALPPMARVITIETDQDALAIPYEILREKSVIQDSINNLLIVAFWTEGTASALDTSVIAEGQEVGAAQVYQAQWEGQNLTFTTTSQDGIFLDEQTQSQWNSFGQAIEGPLEGAALTPIPAINHFWFSWVAFRPETRIYEP